MGHSRLRKSVAARWVQALLVFGMWTCTGAPAERRVPEDRTAVRPDSAAGPLEATGPEVLTEAPPELPVDDPPPLAEASPTEAPRVAAAAPAEAPSRVVAETPAEAAPTVVDGSAPDARGPESEPVELRPDEPNPPAADVDQLKRLAYQAQLEGDAVTAAAHYERMLSASVLDVEAAIRYAWLLNEDARYADALHVLAPHYGHASIERLFERTRFWAEAEGQPLSTATLFAVGAVSTEPVAPDARGARPPATAPPTRSESASGPSAGTEGPREPGPDTSIPGLDFTIDRGGSVLVEMRTQLLDPSSISPTVLAVAPLSRASVPAPAPITPVAAPPLEVAPVEARVGEAESLLAAGRAGAAARLVREAIGDPRLEADPSTSARISRLEDRNLRAQRTLAGAVGQPGDTASGEHLLMLAEVAEERGDITTARASLDAAAEAGASPARISAAERRLDDAARPRLMSGADGMLNGARVRSVAAWAGTSMRPGRGGLELQARVDRTQLMQAGFIRQMTSASLTTDSLFAGDAGRLWGGVYGSFEDQGPTLAGGFLAIELELENGSTWSGRVSHDPIWRRADGVDPLRPLRMRELASVDPSLTTTDFRLRGFLRQGLQGGLHIEGGGTGFGNGNERVFIYGAWRIPLFKDRLRVALEPNAYAESFSGATEGLHTPEGFAAVGARIHAAVRTGGVSVRLEGNPHWFSYPGTSGIGASGSIDATIGLGPVDLVLDGDFLEQAIDSYAQVGLGLAVPIG